MAPKRITAAQAARSFSEVLNRVKYRRESFIVERNRHPICRIEPVPPEQRLTARNLDEFWRTLPRPDPDFTDELEKIHQLFRKLPRATWER